MIIVIITVAILIIGALIMRNVDTFTTDCIGGSMIVIAGTVLFIEGVLIGFSQLVPKQYEKMRAEYTALTRVIDETAENGTIVEKKELYLDIEEYNVGVRRTKRFAASWWTNWFYGPGWEELKEIEY